MKTFELGDSQSILKALEETVELLAANKYEDAFRIFGKHPYFEYTPETLKEAIKTYDEGEGEKVTSAFEAGVPKPNQRESLESEDQEFLSVAHPKFPYCVCWAKEDKKLEPLYAHADLPMDGKWSNLTVKFILDGDDEKCWLVLEDIEVM